MSPILAWILPFHPTFCNEQVPACTRCGWSTGCSKWGGYLRFDPRSERNIRIQRYLCPNEACPAVTFSVAPLGFLPFVRIGLGALCGLLIVAPVLSGNSLARAFDCSRSTIRRRMSWGQRFLGWMTENAVSISDISWNALYGLIFARFFPGRRRKKEDQHNMANYAWGADFVG